MKSTPDFLMPYILEIIKAKIVFEADIITLATVIIINFIFPMNEYVIKAVTKNLTNLPKKFCKFTISCHQFHQH